MNTLTAAALRDMTETDLLTPARAARARLAEAAADDRSASDLHTLVQEVAAAEAISRVRYHVGMMLRADDNDESIREYLMTQLLAGADDTWSGRGNDLRRAMHDAKVAAVREILSALDREAARLAAH